MEKYWLMKTVVYSALKSPHKRKFITGSELWKSLHRLPGLEISVPSGDHFQITADNSFCVLTASLRGRGGSSSLNNALGLF